MFITKAEPCPSREHCTDCKVEGVLAWLHIGTLMLKLCGACLVKLSLETEELCHDVLPAEPAGGG